MKLEAGAFLLSGSRLARDLVVRRDGARFGSPPCRRQIVPLVVKMRKGRG